MSAPGRNAPCPCGSGRKFKQCCLTGTRAPAGIQIADRNAVMQALGRYVSRPEWGEVLGDAALMWMGEGDGDDDYGPDDAFDDVVADDVSAAAFFEWLFFDLPLDDRRTLSDTYLDRHAHERSPRELDWLRLMQRSELRAWQVRDVAPGVGFTARDLLTGDECRVTETTASHELVQWDVIAARLVPHDDGSRQIEGTVLPLPALSAPALERMLKDESRRFSKDFAGEPASLFFKVRAPMLHLTWDELTANAEPPTLVTPEGDPLAMAEIVFDVPMAGEALVTLLKSSDFESGGPGEALWMDKASPTSGPRRVLASVECDAGTLTLRATSRARARQARVRLHELLGPLVISREPHQEPDLSSPPAPGAAPGSPAEGDAGFIDIDSIHELAAWRDRQDRAWLDLEIPMLDGRTPRQAARDRRLKPRLKGLLLDIENREARLAAPRAPRDLTWMWKELGLRRP